MDERVIQDIDSFILQNQEQMFRDIARLVSINSVQGESRPGAPFGPGPAKALELALSIAGDMGLETVNCDGMIGYAQLGRGEKYLATITHLDVVPAGEGWTCDPFTMWEREGYIIGRGVMDDKGPSVLCLYALKYLLQRGIPLRYPVRALLGVNEETMMADVDYYLKNYPAPVFCFSPDAGFPLCNGEKGIYQGRITFRQALGKVRDIRGGLALNAVPDKAEAWVVAEALTDSKGVTVKQEGALWHLTAKGVCGHASEPENTVNAIGVLADYILDRDIVSGEEAELFRFLSLLHSGYDGSAFGLNGGDGRFDPLTLIGGVIGVENGRIFQTVDCRYGTNQSGEKITQGLSAKAGTLADVTVTKDEVPFYLEADNPAVELCMDVYNSVTGENAGLFTMGGGTYARKFPNAVSFGPEHKDRAQPAFAGAIHGVDEAASKQYFIEALKIYIIALLRLEQIDF